MFSAALLTPLFRVSRLWRFVFLLFPIHLALLTSFCAVFYLNQALPFGGTKASGNALRFAGPEGLRGLCNVKAVTEDRLHGLVQTGIPPLLAYPINSGAASWRFVSGLIQLMYGAGIRERAEGIWRLVTAK